MSIKSRRPAEHEQIAEPVELTDAQRAAANQLVADVKARSARTVVDPDSYKTDWVAGQRPAFEAKQRNSTLRYLHRKKVV